MPPSDQEKIAFCEAIERVVLDKDATYLEAILLYCEEIELEEAVAATLVSNSLKSKIEDQARSLHMLKDKISRLPI